MRRAVWVLITLILAATLAACGKKDKPAFAEAEETEMPVVLITPTPSPTPTPEPTPDPTPLIPPGMAMNPLTGLWIDEASANLRPLAFMINNRKPSLPQYGISAADMYYEALAESDITRILAVFQDPREEKIGSMRSARDYFIDFALDHDAIFVHHGGSPQAYKLLRGGVINHIDGMDHDGTIFQRDPDRYAIPFNREDSSFTAGSRLRAYIQEKGWREERNVTEDMFAFYDEPAAPEGDAVAKITVPYMRSFQPYFEYDAASALYSRYEFDAPQMDAALGEQLKVTNVLVQFAKITLVGDSEGRRAVQLVGEGEGLLFTNGVRVPVTWRKDSLESPTKWFGADGGKLAINKGKTWVCVVNIGTELA